MGSLKHSFLVVSSSVTIRVRSSLATIFFMGTIYTPW